MGGFSATNMGEGPSSRSRRDILLYEGWHVPRHDDDTKVKCPIVSPEERRHDEKKKRRWEMAIIRNHNHTFLLTP